MAHRLFEGKEHAASYLKYRISPSTELIGQIINFVEKQKSRPLELAVDVGCGSGQGTVLLSKHFTAVVGTDVSPSQLEMALRYSQEPNITYKQCVAEELPFADSSVDLVTAMVAFHWFDRQRFLQEADRVLKPLGCLALLSYTLEMEISYGDCCTETLNQVCKEFYAALRPYRNSCLGERSIDLYSAAYKSLPYPEKEWQDSFWVRRRMPLSGYMGFAESFSSYQALLREDPERAKSLSRDICQRLMSIMKVESPETEVLVSVKYFYMLARKPQQELTNNFHWISNQVPISGRYLLWCSDSGRLHRMANLTFHVCEDQRLIYHTLHADIGQTVELGCDGAAPNQSVQWALQYRNPKAENLGLALINDETAAEEKVQPVKNRSSLRVTVDRSSYGIIYYCLEKNHQRCDVLRQFNIHLPVELIHRSVGESLELGCSGSSGRQPHLWRMDNSGMAGESHNNTLMFPSLTSSHSGLYVCKQDHVYRRYVYLYVCPEADPPAAAFFTRGENMTLQCGDRTRLGLVYWFMRSSRTVGRVSRVRNDQPDQVCLPDTTLVITNVSTGDSGEFWCVIMRDRQCVFTSRVLVTISEPEVVHHLVMYVLCIVVIMTMMSVTVAMIWRNVCSGRLTAEDVQAQAHWEHSAMANRLFEGKEHAASYWKYRLCPSELVERAVKFLEKQKSGPFELAVDVGCGSGQATVVLAKHFSSVIGTDVSPAQLDMAAQHSTMPNITYIECAAEKLPVPESSADLVTAGSAFHWFDGPSFLKEVDRVLKPGGCLAMFNFTHEMELSYPDCCQQSLLRVCDEFQGAIHPYWSHLLKDDVQNYFKAYTSIPYSEKEWHKEVRVRRSVPLSSYIGLVESFSSYQALRRADPQRADSLSRDVCQRLMSVMKVTSAETEVELTVKYYLVLASKPQL
ncbi:uncharacterized protein ACB057_006354 [Neosynchiropus ocellatus]